MGAFMGFPAMGKRNRYHEFFIIDQSGYGIMETSEGFLLFRKSSGRMIAVAEISGKILVKIES